MTESREPTETVLDTTLLYECPMCHEPTLSVSVLGRLWCRRLECGFFAFEGEYPISSLQKTEHSS